METPPPSSPIETPTEPELKKFKMSTTSDEDTTSPAAAPEKKTRYKRRKVAIFFAYCGVGYQGMQKNPGAKTIEGDLEEALFHSGAVPEQDRGCPKRFDWARSARTDKGVSAVGQVVSGRFYIDPPGLVDRLNSILPPQIRIFGYNRVTASFNAKKFCDRRRYVYLLPVFALDPSSHPDRESVLASLGSENELVKCLECSERGRKVEGIMGKRVFERQSNDSSKDVIIQETNGTAISSNQGTTMLQNELVEEVMVSSEETKTDKLNSDNLEDNGACIDSEIRENIDFGMGKEGNGTSLSCRESELMTDVVLKENGNHNLNLDHSNRNDVAKIGITEVVTMKESGFRYGAEQGERFNRILKQYEGTHNFHNFTTRTKAEDPSAKRYIISFEANTVVNVDGIEFVKCEVVGQSFMLHQIRKMVGVAVAIMRNCANESLIETAFQQDVRVNVPTAPEVGLYLDECFFSSYNQKWKDTHEELSMKPYAGAAEEFRMKHIYSLIASTEHKEGAVALWLHSLNHRNYPDLRIGGQ